MKFGMFVELLKQHGIKFAWEIVCDDYCNKFGSNETNLFKRMVLTLDEDYLDNIKNPDSYIKDTLIDLFAIEDIDKRFYNSCTIVLNDIGKKCVNYCYKSNFKCANEWIETLSISKLEGLLEHIGGYKDQLSGINYILDVINKFEDSSMTLTCNNSDGKFLSTLSINGCGLELDIFIKDINRNILINIDNIKNKEIDEIIKLIYTLVIFKYSKIK